MVCPYSWSSLPQIISTVLQIMLCLHSSGVTADDLWLPVVYCNFWISQWCEHDTHSVESDFEFLSFPGPVICGTIPPNVLMVKRIRIEITDTSLLGSGVDRLQDSCGVRL